MIVNCCSLGGQEYGVLLTQLLVLLQVELFSTIVPAPGSWGWHLQHLAHRLWSTRWGVTLCRMHNLLKSAIHPGALCARCG